MPKQVAEIKQFTAGIIATPDARDIPADAADYSVNVETVASDGMIKGRKADVLFYGVGGFKGSAGTGDINFTFMLEVS